MSHRVVDNELEVNSFLANRRRKQVLITDAGSTIITSQSLDNLAALSGLGDTATAVIKRSMAGKIDFEGVLFMRVSTLLANLVTYLIN